MKVSQILGGGVIRLQSQGNHATIMFFSLLLSGHITHSTFDPCGKLNTAAFFLSSNVSCAIPKYTFVIVMYIVLTGQKSYKAEGSYIPLKYTAAADLENKYVSHYPVGLLETAVQNAVVLGAVALGGGGVMFPVI